MQVMSLSYSADTTGTKGGSITVDQSSGKASYRPPSHFYGQDSFTFKTNDGNLDSNSGKILVNIKDRAPIVSLDIYPRLKMYQLLSF